MLLTCSSWNLETSLLLLIFSFFLLKILSKRVQKGVKKVFQKKNKKMKNKNLKNMQYKYNYRLYLAMGR